MKYLINDIVKSKHHIGSTFYICAYQPGKNNIRALQNIKCTKVIIQDVDMYNSVVQYPTTFYYSEVAIIGLYKMVNQTIIKHSNHLIIHHSKVAKMVQSISSIIKKNANYFIYH